MKLMIGILTKSKKDVSVYKDYQSEEYRKVADRCSERLRVLLQTRYNKVEEFREAINDRYPFEDLFLRMYEVDYEKELIQKLLEYLSSCLDDHIKAITRENIE